MAGKKRVALVTIVIGDEYTSMFKRLCEPSWLAYAERHGYDLVVIDDVIDPSPRARARSLNWQKCLISEHPEVKDRYETVVWLDADIVINVAKAPCVVSACVDAPDKIGCVSLSRELENPANRANIMGRTVEFFWPDGIEPTSDLLDFYRRYGYKDYKGEAINGGLFVFRPELHASLFRCVYDECEHNAHSSSEEVPLSHAICQANAQHLLDYRFNTIWDWELVRNYPYLYLPNQGDTTLPWMFAVNTVMMNSYFVHFLKGPSRKGIDFVLQGGLTDAERLKWLALAVLENRRRQGGS